MEYFEEIAYVEAFERLGVPPANRDSYAKSSVEFLEITLATMLNEQLDAGGGWQCGWPLPWFHFDSTQFVDNDPSPYFAIHHLSEWRPYLPGILINSILYGLVSFSATIGLIYLGEQLRFFRTFRTCLVIVLLAILQWYLVQPEILEKLVDQEVARTADLPFVSVPPSLALEMCAARIVNPTSSLLVFLACVILIHPRTFLRITKEALRTRKCTEVAELAQLTNKSLTATR